MFKRVHRPFLSTPNSSPNQISCTNRIVLPSINALAGNDTTQANPSCEAVAFPISTKNEPTTLLQRLLAESIQNITSLCLARSPRLTRLLQYVASLSDGLNETALTERTIALNVFDRSPDFDPRFDPIVRVEASRLRKRLSEYYRREGATEIYRIYMPRGGYRVYLRPNDNRQSEVLTLTIRPLKGHFLSCDPSLSAENISALVIYNLTRVSLARVVPYQYVDGISGLHSGTNGPQLILEITLIHTKTTHARLHFSLIDTAVNFYIWTGSYEMSAATATQDLHVATSALAAALEQQKSLQRISLPKAG